MKRVKYIKIILLTVILVWTASYLNGCLIYKIGEKMFLDLVEDSAEEERQKRHEETSVKKEIKTEQGDIFIEDFYMDPYTIENMMDIYQKVDNEEILLIEGAYGIEKGIAFKDAHIDFKFFINETNDIQGYYIQDKPFILYKNKDEEIYKVADINNVNSIHDKEDLKNLIPFIYEYMLSIKPSSVKLSAMEFLAVSEYEDGIKIMEDWSQGIFTEEIEMEYSEEEKMKLVEYSNYALQIK